MLKAKQEIQARKGVELEKMYKELEEARKQLEAEMQNEIEHERIKRLRELGIE